MIIERIEELHSNTYLVGNEKEFIIIDPSVDIRNINFVISKKFSTSKLVGIFLTHGHYDHFSTLDDVLKKYKVPIYISKEDQTKLSNINLSCAFFFGVTNLNEFENIINYKADVQFETLRFQIYKTPGHTNGSVCIKIENNLFSGDTLFNNGVGRTDLPTGNEKQLIESLKYLMKLEKNLVVSNYKLQKKY